MPDVFLIDGGPTKNGFGEIRTAVLNDASLTELHYYRDTAPIQDGDIFMARVTRTTPGLDGVFLTLASGLDAFLPHRSKAPKPAEGSLLPVEVRVCPRAGKEAVVTRTISNPAALDGLKDGPRKVGLFHRARFGWLAPVLKQTNADIAAIPDIDAIILADPDLYAAAREHLKATAPHLADCLSLDRETPPLMERMGVEAEIDALFEPRRPLPSGGCLTIEETTAGTVIDVDSGTASGGDSEAVALLVNTEAAREIARQLRLRRTGGLVFVDFISMQRVKSKKTVLRALDETLAHDPTQTERTGLSHFGVVELMRARRGTPLLDQIATPGSQPRHAPATNGHAILRALSHEANRAPGRVLVVSCDADTGRWLDARLDPVRAALHADIVLEPDPGPHLNKTRWSVYSRTRS